MSPRSLSLTAVASLIAALPALGLAAPRDRWFELVGRPLGGTAPALPTPAYLSTSRFAAVDDGALVIDADSGTLIRTDRVGTAIAQLAIGPDAGPLTFDPGTRRAYVVDRRADRVVVVTVGDGLVRTHAWSTPVEPVAVALTPGGRHVLVVTGADRALVALDALTGREAWRAPLGAEPRGLAVSPDGTRALVTYVSAGAVDVIDLASHAVAPRVLASPEPEPVPVLRFARKPLPLPMSLPLLNAAFPRKSVRKSPPRRPRRFVRGAFAALFLGAGQAVVPFQTETPVGQPGGDEDTGSYGGGGAAPPIEHHLAMLGFSGDRPRQVGARVQVVAPRALAWDGVRDALYVAGVGADRIVQVTGASQARARAGLAIVVALPGGTTACGPDGLAVAPDGDLLVWCAFTRQVVRVDLVGADGAWTAGDAGGRLPASAVAAGPVLAPSALTAAQHAGLELFHRPSRKTSDSPALACVSCHPDGRADGLSWRIEGHTLQTPVLAGRITGTHPYKWDGGDPTLAASITGTVARLGGRGLAPDEVAALAAYVERIPSARTPTRDPAAVARGQFVFDGKAGCKTCHDGAAYTDTLRYRFKGTLRQSDTPSLRGLAASAPYYHDGSAPTLEVLVRGGGAVHGMADTRDLSDAEVTDLVAFLETR